MPLKIFKNCKDLCLVWRRGNRDSVVLSRQWSNGSVRTVWFIECSLIAFKPLLSPVWHAKEMISVWILTLPDRFSGFHLDKKYSIWVELTYATEGVVCLLKQFLRKKRKDLENIKSEISVLVKTDKTTQTYTR